MNDRSFCAIALIGGALLAGSPAAQADNLDALLARGGQFELNNSKTKILAGGGEIRRYRVCMDEGPGSVPLKVTCEGNETIVEPGECQLIEGRKIKLASASRLTKGMTLIASFQNTKKYSTSVSLAAASRKRVYWPGAAGLNQVPSAFSISIRFLPPGRL